MRKALIIKGADFSTNAIEDINLSGKRIFTADNTDGTFTGNISINTSGNINFSSSGSNQYKIYKVNSNEILYIPRQTNNFNLFFCNSLVTSAGESTPAFNNLKQIAVNPTSTSSQFASEKGVAIKGEKDYYVAVMIGSTSNVAYYFPDSIFVTQEYEPNRELTEENYDSKITGRYINNNGSWGSDQYGIFYFYNVFKGETIHIKSNSTKKAVYAIFSQNIQMATGTVPQYTALELNDEIDIPITNIGQCIGIKKRTDNATNNAFPAELYTYSTPEQEETNE